jgi:hypothetical protein
VSKLRGGLLAAFFGVLGVCSLLIAITSRMTRCSSSGQTLMLKYGTESVPVTRRLPRAARIEAQVGRLLKEYSPAVNA